MKQLTLFSLIFIFFSLSIHAQEDSKGKIFGLMFGDYFYSVSRDTGISFIPNKALEGSKDLNGFQFRRIYFSYDYNISKTFSSRFRLALEQTSTNQNTKGDVFVKDAYLKWKDIFEGSDFIFGIQPTPAFQVSENFWGYRSLEKTILDLRGIVSSRDLSISLKGRLNKEKTINYWVMFGNGSNNISETDKYKRIYANLNFIPDKKITITIYGDLKFQKNVASPINPDEKLSYNVFSTAAFIGFTEDKFKIGAEGFIQINQNDEIVFQNLTLKKEARNAIGISLFGNYIITSQVSLLGRYDYFDPNSDLIGDMRNYFILGLNYKPVPKVEITPNILLETYESTGNRSYNSSLTGRITFYYNFL